MIIDITASVYVENKNVTFCLIEDMSQTINGEEYEKLSIKEQNNYIIKSHLDVLNKAYEVDVLNSDVISEQQSI